MAIAPNARRRVLLAVLAVFLADSVAGCDRDLSPKPDPQPRTATTGKRRVDTNAQSIFGGDGVSVGTISSRDGNIFGLGGDEGGRLPVNKYLWQASLDTLSFLPLASSDPFTGVIATEWSTNPEVPNERFKVTAFITSADLSAGSLKVAAYRELRTEEGVWVPAPVSPETARRLEDAILVRAREIRIAEREGRAAG